MAAGDIESADFSETGYSFTLSLISGARASFQRNAGLFAIARDGCLSGLQRVS